MMIDRRQLLAGLTATTLSQNVVATAARAGVERRAAYGAACKIGDDAYAVATFDSDGRNIVAVPLPARGHDMVVKPGHREAVVFARRPGHFALAFDLDGRRPPHVIARAEHRHFFGHGIFSGDGNLLLSTENDIRGGRGVLGVRDATNGYREVGVIATGGIGPHDVVLLSDKRTLVIANGGIDTDPQGREPIYLSAMRPSLSYVDARNGDIVEQVEFAADLRPLSIRHLAVAANDTVVIGCQWAGDMLEHPQLVAVHRRGQPLRRLDMPAKTLRKTRNYIGSVSVDQSGTIAAVSAPKGGLVIYFDVENGRYLGEDAMADVCGVAADGSEGVFRLSSGDGVVRRETLSRDGQVRHHSDVATPYLWDNHLVRL